jgi:hypothetical protein
MDMMVKIFAWFRLIDKFNNSLIANKAKKLPKIEELREEATIIIRQINLVSWRAIVIIAGIPSKIINPNTKQKILTD